jgi:hypothetical protein
MAVQKQYRKNIKNRFEELRNALQLDGNPTRGTIITEAIAFIRQNNPKGDTSLRPPERANSTCAGINMSEIAEKIRTIGFSNAITKYIGREYTQIVSGEPIMYDYGQTLYVEEEMRKQAKEMLPDDKCEYVDAVLTLLYCKAGKDLGHDEEKVYALMFGNLMVDDIMDSLSQEVEQI